MKKFKITGIDILTHGRSVSVEIEVDLSKDNLLIMHYDEYIEIVVNDEREVVTPESFEIE